METLANGITEDALVTALERLARDHPPIGVVCGSGFEDRPQLLSSVAARWPLFGNSAAVVKAVKDPKLLSEICCRLEIPFPEFSMTKPDNPADWLAKRVGGAGGSHIRPASQRPSPTAYYQRRVPGTPVSALFLANGIGATVVGFSTQWTLGTPTRPYRYGGAVRPALLPSELAALLSSTVDRLAGATSLVGLNSIDFHVSGERFWLLDINPRPGATLDIFEPPGQSLFAFHMLACAGRLSEAPNFPSGATAAAIVYADQDIASIPALEWPHWTADRPQPGISVKAGEPLCTVFACDPAASEAKALADERRQTVLTWVRAR
jgi:predicted ATP-grasp superfamily ATP-dependent carboligase